MAIYERAPRKVFRRRAPFPGRIFKIAWFICIGLLGATGGVENAVQHHRTWKHGVDVSGRVLERHKVKDGYRITYSYSHGQSWREETENVNEAEYRRLQPGSTIKIRTLVKAGVPTGEPIAIIPGQKLRELIRADLTTACGFLFVGVGFGLTGVWRDRFEYRLTVHGCEACAEVVKVTPRGNDRLPILEITWTDGDGHLHRSHTYGTSDKRWQMGDGIPLFYNPSRPKSYVMDTENAFEPVFRTVAPASQISDAGRASGTVT